MQALLLVALAIAAVRGDVALDVSPVKRFPLNPNLHSIFFETEINYGCEGGLYAEMVANRDFETQGRGLIPTCAAPEPRRKDPLQPGLDPNEPPANPQDYRPWTSIGQAQLELTNSTQPFTTNPMTLKVTGRSGDGFSNPGYWGMNFELGESYHLSFYASSRNGGWVAVRFSGSSVANIFVQGEKWTKYEASIQALSTNHTGSLELIFQGQFTIFFDSISLMPKSAVGGLFRKDLIPYLTSLKPGFMRTPGGNYLEGTGPRTRWNWKQTIGPKEARPGHYNTAWGYWVTDGVGLYEMLLLAEILNTEPQLSVFTGYSMGQPYIPLKDSQVFAQDALDLIEFANGSPNTPYGAKRVQAGHPNPFNLKRLEVGNEERLMGPDEYPAHYKLITEAIWKQYPDMYIVASGRWGPPIDGNPCITGQRCDAWDDHYYRKPDDMAALRTAYDSYNRSWPDVFVGEFAANGDKPSLRAAIAEAAFMLGFENNADKVVASSFAPLFRRVEGVQWSYDLINFDSYRSFGLPSFFMQTMLSNAGGGSVLQTILNGGNIVTIATASSNNNTIHIKLVNYSGNSGAITINLNGVKPAPEASGTLTVLTNADPNAENSLDQPLNVMPTVKENISIQSSFSLDIPAWSLSVLSFPAQ
eukprot:m.122502 g.122502  ORF g.122502 m.122502 type:complete len:642 (-) comp9630_c0_seq2:40-1965(-)